jgi:hypothetical protein
VPWLIGQAFEGFGPRILIYALLADLLAAAAVLAVLVFYSPRPANTISHARPTS